MSPDVLTAITSALELKLKGAKECPSCGMNQWGVNGVYQFAPQDRIGGGFVIGGQSAPYISLACSGCGYSRFYSLVLLLGRERYEQLAKAEQGGAILRNLE